MTGIGQLVTPSRGGPIHGLAMRELDIIDDAAIAIRGPEIVWAGRASDWTGDAEAVHDCGGRAAVPGLIDPHTHAMWGGERLGDFEARVSGVSYETILARGGGIRSTVRQTTAATEEELVNGARERIHALMRSGATTIEVKSGYGFTIGGELRMLRAIAAVSRSVRATIAPTLLLHLPPSDASEREAYLAEVCATLIPEAAQQKLATAVDVFVEKEAWSATDAVRLIDCARAYGMSSKLHTEQFHRTGGLECGVREEVMSVDHLEACIPEQFSMLAHSRTVATIVPGVSLHLGIPAANGRALVDAGAAVAIGTDLNPGSSPLFSIAEAAALAVRLNGLTPGEAFTAVTANAAAALRMTDRGRIAPGARADIAVLESRDWRDLTHTLGMNMILELWVGGEMVTVQ